MRWALLGAVLLLGAGAAAAQDAAPVLRIETGTHTSRMQAAAVDAAGRVLITASDDKTARLWSLPDLRPLGVLRPPIGEGNDGKLFAAAVSPDGRLAAVGGILGQSETSVLLFDLQTRQEVRNWGRLPSVVEVLAFSADGRHLVAGMGTHGIRVWNASDGSEAFADGGYGDSVYGASFAADGRLVTSSYDGSIRLYDVGGHLVRKVAAIAGQRPYRVAFTPDGREIAIGFVDVPAVEIRDASSLALLARPDVTGLNAKHVERLAWSADGGTLYAGGDTWIDGAYRVLMWPLRGHGKRQVVAVASGFTDALSNLLPLPGRNLLVTSLSAELMVTAADGRRIATILPTNADMIRSNDINDVTRRFLVSTDGRRVALAQWGAGGRWDVADTRGFEVTSATAAPRDLADWSSSASGLAVTDWDTNTDPKLNGRLLALEHYERSVSVAVRPGRALLGADFSLRLFDAGGKQVWQQTAPGVAWRVNQSADGRLAIAAFGDGTVRWFRTTDGKELLALFLTRDAKRWVAWTPSGYYTASPGGEALIGWHLNRGPDKAADFFPAAQFRDRFYRPDVVTHVLDTLDEAEALRLADAARGTATRPAAPITEDLPPVVSIVSPVDGSTVTTEQATITYSVRSPSGKPVRNVRVLLDGRPAPAARGLGRMEPGTEAGETRGQVAVAVPAGQTVEVALLAETETRVSEPARLRLSRAAAPAPATTHRAALYALVVGVADYNDAGLRLEYSGKDARDLAAVLGRNGGGLYREVKVKLLADHDATRDAVLDGLDWLRTQTTADDVAVLFLAGHGTNDPTGRFYFLPVDTDVKRLRSTAVAGSEVKDALSATPGRVVAFLDTCHSGSVLGGNFRAVPDIDGLANELSSAESGLIVFTSSTGRELSAELPSLHNGAFTAALLEGLSGKADADHKGAVTIEDLNYYVLQRVKALTNGEQHPNELRPQSIRDFPLLAVAR